MTFNPTPEQIEAAAEAIRKVESRSALISDVDLPTYKARAALVAAAGAAPQAESGEPWLDAAGNEAQRRLRCGKYAFECCESFAPVLPSSTVDEDALAEEIGRHKLVHVSVSRKSAFCACSPKVTAGVEDNRAWFEGHRARAVAEWFMWQER